MFLHAFTGLFPSKLNRSRNYFHSAYSKNKMVGSDLRTRLECEKFQNALGGRGTFYTVYGWLRVGLNATLSIQPGNG